MNIETAVKQRLVGSAVGDLMERVRERWERACASSTTVGTLVNDQLSRVLLVGLACETNVFMDIGAHIGSVFSQVHRRSPSTKVIAVEAMPDKANWLKRRFPKVVVHQCAAGQTAGDVEFFVQPKQSGYSSLAHSPHSVKINVSMKPLDTLVETVDVMKMDIEGAELGALKGMVRIMSSARPTTMFESAPGAGEKLGYPLVDLFDFFSDHNYCIFVPNRLPHTGPALTRDSFVEAHEFPRRTTNYFAIPYENVDQVRTQARRLIGVN